MFESRDEGEVQSLRRSELAARWRDADQWITRGMGDLSRGLGEVERLGGEGGADWAASLVRTAESLEADAKRLRVAAAKAEG